MEIKRIYLSPSTVHAVNAVIVFTSAIVLFSAFKVDISTYEGIVFPVIAFFITAIWSTIIMIASFVSTLQCASNRRNSVYEFIGLLALLSIFVVAGIISGVRIDNFLFIFLINLFLTFISLIVSENVGRIKKFLH